MRFVPSSGGRIFIVAVCYVLVALSVQAQTNGVLRDLYLEIPGTTLNDLTTSANFPNNPSSQSVLPSFEAPADSGDAYGQRLQALVIAPATGAYTFWIASDDSSALYLSTDATPANKAQIASVPDWTASRDWIKYPQQQSAPVSLVQGQSYYIEALMKEGGGGDNLAVRWQLPDGTIEEPIGGSRLIVYGLGPPQVTQQPASVTVVEGSSVSFTVRVTRPFGMSYQWQRGGVDIPGATNSTYTIVTTSISDSGAVFRCVLNNSFGGGSSSNATLTVSADVTPPTLSSVSNLGDHAILSLLFSEPLEQATASFSSNYQINNGVQVLGATLNSDLRSVVLRTSPLSSGQTYTLTVNNVRDRASTPNTMATAQQTFSLTFTPLSLDQLLGPKEPLGFSSRRTTLVISEVMYHPADRADLKNLEFIEIYNSQLWSEDISGYRLSGDVDYEFPANTIIPSKGFLVVAASPADLQSVAGVTGALGPYTNSLPNGSGLIRLRNRIDAVLLEIQYSDEHPWPVAADGAGHSLVLARPSYGEGNPLAWQASSTIGGSPKAAERAADRRPVLINELLVHTDVGESDFIELFNYSSQAVSISGCFLTDSPNTNKFTIPANTIIPARGFVSFTEAQLGFSLSTLGETVLFRAPDFAVIDAFTFEPQVNGIAIGRLPDGAPTWNELSSKTPGTNNAAQLPRDVVINEIMYDPVSGSDDDQFVELHNKGTNAIDLGGWAFRDGIDFRFATNTIIPANGYVVVAKNLARLRTNNTSLTPANSFGNFGGKLSGSGERLVLSTSMITVVTNSSGVAQNQLIWIPVDEVTYANGGRWGSFANRGGSSLELIDARSDNRLAPNWADSDESSKAGWTTVQHTGVLDNGNGAIDELQLFLQDAGEALVDDVEVFDTASGVNLVPNGGFEGGLGQWVPQGNHDLSRIENVGLTGSRSLRVRALSRGDHGANRVRVPLTTSLNAGMTVTIRAKVRWLRGGPDILLRLHGNYLEAIGTMSIPANLGTPGAQNSARRPNAAPAIHNVSHFPILPANAQPITVRAQVNDPDGLARLVVNYRVDPATNFSSVAMSYNGAGFYTATIPGQAAGALIAFHVAATDANAASASATFPNDAPVREALVRYGETEQPGFPNYRIWMTEATRARWTARLVNDNTDYDTTFVLGNQRAIYNVGGLYSGSPFISPGYNGPTGNLCGYVLHFPEDEKLLGVTDFVLDWPIRGAPQQLEQAAYWIADQMGLPIDNRRFVNLYVNGNRRGQIYEDAQQPNSDVIKEHFPDNDNGELFKIQDWFEFNDNARMEFNVDATLENFTTTGGAKKLARYRWTWQRRAGGDINGYTNLFGLVDALQTQTPEPFTSQVGALIDLEEWLGVIALEHIVGNWDSYGYRRGKNMYAYRPPGGRFRLFMWDIDFVMDGGGDPVDADLFGSNEPMMAKMLNHPPFRRIYMRALQRAVDGPLMNSRIDPILDVRHSALIANGSSPGDPTGTKSWLSQRRDYIISQLADVNGPFSITVNGGNGFSTNSNLVVISGTSPIRVKDISINGVNYPVTWTSTTDWVIRYALASGANTLNVQGIDESGLPLAGASDTIAINFTGTSEAPEDKLVINEIMYNAVVPQASYLEFHNTSLSNAFDLTGLELRGLGFTFETGTVLAPGAYALVVSDRQAFAATYGNSSAVVGEYGGTLQNNGETITLLRPANGPVPEKIIDQVTYGNVAPWPTSADGFGPSLQLIDAKQDNNRVSNWAAVSDGSSATPEWQYVTATGVAGASGSLYMYLEAPGQVHLDDVKLVAGSVPESGANLIANGDFETAFPGPWVVAANHSASTTTTAIKQSGSAALRMVASQGGSTASSAIVQNLALTIGQTYTLSYWYLPSTNGPTLTIRFSGNWIRTSQSTGLGGASALYTPGTANSVRSNITPFPTLRINEIQPNNVGGPVDRFGERDPWLEIHNSGTSVVSLAGLRLTDTYTNLNLWAFPSNAVINAGQFLVVWADGQVAQSNATEFHTNFRLSSTNGSIALVQSLAGSTRVIDYINYAPVSSGRSFGSFPDSNPGARQVFHRVTPGATNNGASLPIPVVINEWMASNTGTIADPADAPITAFDDWIELYNPTTNAVDIGGYYLTDNLTNSLSLMWRIPTGTMMAPQSYLLVWADEQGTQNGLNADLHANFKLGKAGEAIGLFAPDRSQIDAINFGPQTNDVSQGRYQDGGPQIYFMTSPTPRAANILGGVPSNTAPVLAPITDRNTAATRTVTFTASATDAEAPPQVLTFSLDPGAPAGASINPSSGVFVWTVPSNQPAGTNFVTIRVSDNASPSLSASRVVQIIVSARPTVSGSVEISNGMFAISWAGIAGRTYRIEYKDNLEDLDWNVLGADRVSSGERMVIYDTATRAQRFYRIVLLD